MSNPVPPNPDHVLSVNDVYNVVAEHMAALDAAWPDGDHAPRKVAVVELIDGIKLKLALIAEKNASRYESTFEKAARRITGFTQGTTSEKSPAQVAHEAAQARMRRNP